MVAQFHAETPDGDFLRVTHNAVGTGSFVPGRPDLGVTIHDVEYWFLVMRDQDSTDDRSRLRMPRERVEELWEFLGRTLGKLPSQGDPRASDVPPDAGGAL